MHRKDERKALTSVSETRVCMFDEAGPTDAGSFVGYSSLRSVMAASLDVLPEDRRRRRLKSTAARGSCNAAI